MADLYGKIWTVDFTQLTAGAGIRIVYLGFIFIHGENPFGTKNNANFTTLTPFFINRDFKFLRCYKHRPFIIAEKLTKSRIRLLYGLRRLGF